MAFSQTDYNAAQPLFHRAAAKSKDGSVALSAKYFEARGLGSTKRTDDALGLYLQVAEAKSQYRDDARATAGAMLLARGKRAEALKQYEALSNEAEKSATKAEGAVRAGLIATDLAVADRGKTDKVMADKAKLLKAESLYKQQKFTEAAPVYEELRGSQLNPKLRAEAAYKLGWSCIQLKDAARVIETFSYFIKTFPESPQAPIALIQRALAYQQSNNLDAAVADLNFLINNYPAAKEREAALQQKALLLGEQNREPEMAQTFQQLLKEFP